MIREKAVFNKLNQLSFSDRKLFDLAVAAFDPLAHCCPLCHALGQFQQIHSYERDLIYISCGKRKQISLSVPRFQCTSCGHTHAVLPDILIPFGSYSLRFILTVLKEYLNRTVPVADLCLRWDIAISTLYDWIHLFQKHYNSWCRILDRVHWVTMSALLKVADSPEFPSFFSRQFGFSFLQSCQTTQILPILSQSRRHFLHPT